MQAIRRQFWCTRRPSSSRRRATLESLETRRLLERRARRRSATSADLRSTSLEFRGEPGADRRIGPVPVARRGSTVFLDPTEAVLCLQGSAPGPVDVVRLRLQGADPAVRGAGRGLLPSTTNYLIGNDPARWQTGVASYAQVVYQDVYPGVDLVYHGNQQDLEYDFDLAPGVSPGVIRLAVEGAEAMTLDAAGNLVLQTAGGNVVEQAPVLYQQVGGSRHAVSGGFAIGADGTVGFEVGAYDPTQPLVIDPTLSYSTYLGGTNGATLAQDIAVDSQGSAYVVGLTTSTTFPTTPGVFEPAPGGTHTLADVFVAKLDPTGSSLVYATYLGGTSSYINGNGNTIDPRVAVDSSGNLYITGQTSATDFPVTAGACRRCRGRTAAAGQPFLTKLNPSGTGLVYSTFFGGTGQSFVTGDRARRRGRRLSHGKEHFFRTCFPPLRARSRPRLRPRSSPIMPMWPRSIIPVRR